MRRSFYAYSEPWSPALATALLVGIIIVLLEVAYIALSYVGLITFVVSNLKRGFAIS